MQLTASEVSKYLLVFYLARQAICHSNTSLPLLNVIKACICSAGVSGTVIMVSIQTHSKQQVAREQACCRLYAVTATLAANPCTRAGRDVPLPRRRVGLEQGSYRHVQHTHKEGGINIESDISCIPLWEADEVKAPTSA